MGRCRRASVGGMIEAADGLKGRTVVVGGEALEPEWNMDRAWPADRFHLAPTVATLMGRG
eukprot:2944503-Prymnesium_polylepis.2